MSKPVAPVPGDENYRKPWDTIEDKLLRDLVSEHGTQQWALIASEMHNRNGKQCRERWHNQLDTALSRDGADAGLDPHPSRAQSVPRA
jgi:hypothetical protein